MRGKFCVAGVIASSLLTGCEPQPCEHWELDSMMSLPGRGGTREEITRMMGSVPEGWEPFAAVPADEDETGAYIILRRCGHAMAPK